MEKVLKFVDFKYFWNVLIALAIFAVCMLLIHFFNVEDIYENTLLENTQLIVLAGAFIMCLKAKNNKVLFNFGAMVIFLMFMREISYGRCLFAQMPDNPHMFYHWSHYKYGWLAHVIIGIYIACSCLYAIVNKIWLDVKNVFQNVRFPFWDLVVMALFVVFQMLGEKVLDSTCLEETAEFSLYCAIFALVYYYRKRLSTK